MSTDIAAELKAAKNKVVAIPSGVVEKSDDHLSTLFVTKHLDCFRYTGSLHNRWLHYDGTRWVEDDRMLRYTKVREVARSLARDEDSDSLRRSLTSASRINAVVEMSKSDQRVVLDREQLDADAVLLNTPEGTYHLMTGERRDHSRLDYITKITRIAPKKGTCPVFKLFLMDVFQGDTEVIDFMQVALGYCLTGLIKEQVFFFAHGGGKNGKSTLFDVIEEIIGSYGNNLSATALMSQKNSQHSTDIAMLEGVRMAFTTELDKAQRWNIPVLKSLTGNQRIAARKMKKDAGSFRNRVKLVISGNDLPSFEGGDAAMERRILLIPFNAYFSEDKRDKDMPEKLMAEAPQILQWLIDGAVRYFTEGLVVPEKVKSESSKYFAEMDTVKAWSDTCLTAQKGGFLSSKDLLEHYQEWSEDTNMSPTEFKKHMGRLGFEHKRTKSARGFINVIFASAYGER